MRASYINYIKNVRSVDKSNRGILQLKQGELLIKVENR